uniref:Uncharacterized protein n=1 Tax=Arundo donax TaxID=35708 RepID=A0A0A9CGL4_ARUDO
MTQLRMPPTRPLHYALSRWPHFPRRCSPPCHQPIISTAGASPLRACSRQASSAAGSAPAGNDGATASALLGLAGPRRQGKVLDSGSRYGLRAARDDP